MQTINLLIPLCNANCLQWKSSVILCFFLDGKYKTVNVVDTAGSMEFPAMRELRIRSATAIIIVYNVNDSVSINSASELKRQVQKMRGEWYFYPSFSF